MALILADTSAWVEFDRKTGSRVHLRLRRLLHDAAPDDVLAATEPVQMELLAGARAYRLCRRRGVTPRGLVDCMIVAIAHRTQAAVLAHDADLARIADVIGVRLDPASLRP